MSPSETRDGIDEPRGTAASLRRSFDENFAVPFLSTIESQEGLLAIRVGGDPYALRLSDISSLHTDVKIVAVASPVSQLLGIVGLRGMMAPVYDLAALMRHPPPARARWMVLAGTPHPAGFAFETLEAHLRVPAASVASEDDPRDNANGRLTVGTERLTRGTVRAAGALRPIIHMAFIMELIRNNES